jgi:inorganic pyrophosphatase
MPLSRHPPFDRHGDLRVVVECPRGAQVKLAWDQALGAMALARPLPLGFRYPFDWGFVPGTRAGDGDPVDAMIVWDVPSFPGVVVACRPLGVVALEQDDGEGGRQRNDRILAVPTKDPRSDELTSIDDLPARVREEIAQFFLSSVYFEPKNPKILDWEPVSAVRALIDRSR